MVIYGLNPVIEALKVGTVREVFVAQRADARLAEVRHRAVSAGISVSTVSADALTARAGTPRHQGVVALVEAQRRAWTLDDVLTGERHPLLLVLDGVEDPQNVGALLRTADAAGVTGILRQERHAAAIGGAVAKASAGALLHVRLVDVVNIARAIGELKSRGVWTVGLAGDGDADYVDLDYRPPTAFVLGSEGQGLRRLVREQCDFLARIPMHGHVSSLNVSAAAAVVLYEAVRQRRRHTRS